MWNKSSQQIFGRKEKHKKITFYALKHDIWSSAVKQARTLNDKQLKAVFAHCATRRHAARDRAIVAVSFMAGLRAKEIATLDWSMLTDASGMVSDAVRLEDRASKGRSGGVVYMSKRLLLAVQSLGDVEMRSGAVIKSRSGGAMTAQVVTNWFFNLYRELGFEGCSSHSGRRTAITTWARKISSVGGSLRDVQALARHSSIATTQKYIEISENACRRVVG